MRYFSYLKLRKELKRLEALLAIAYRNRGLSKEDFNYAVEYLKSINTVLEVTIIRKASGSD